MVVLCTYVESAAMNPIAAATRAYKLRSSWLGDGGQPVPVPLANARAAICLHCPLNSSKAWESIAGDVMSWALRVNRFKEQMHLHSDEEKKLHICDACSCVLRLKVWVPLEHVVETTPLEKLDQKCWILAEREKS